MRGAGAEKELLQLAEALGCAVAVQPGAKGFFPEDHPQFVGIFWGQVSTLGADSIVHWADAIICAGTIFTDYSTVGWTALPNIPQMVAEMDHVTLNVSRRPFQSCSASRLSVNLTEKVIRNDSTMVEYIAFAQTHQLSWRSATKIHSPVNRSLGGYKHS